MDKITIAFLSNTITKPFDRFLKEFTIVHYPLDTTIEQLYSNPKEDILIILLDVDFFKNDFQLLRNAISAFRENSVAKILINTISEDYNDIYSPATIQKEIALVELNAKIVSLSVDFTNIGILDLSILVKRYGYKNLINEKNKYLFQTPFTKLALELLAKSIEDTLTLFETPRIKAICVDADNTLWGGVVGEDGIDGIKIDNNYPGVVYTKFQNYLLELQKSGIILILLSKNDEQLVKEVFQTKNMPLKLDDFVEYAINWNSKSENLDQILQKLKLTKSSIIFLDDSDVEVSEMRTRTGIDSYKMNPQNPLQNITTLQNITALRTLHLSSEDEKKTALYKDEKLRQTLNETLGSKADFIASLEIKVQVRLNNLNNIERITQLTNKTNQFNLTTNRYTLSEIQQYMQADYVYDFSVNDKFGDMGLVGVVIIKSGIIDSFLMSCRVLGRGIEESVLAFVTTQHPNLLANFRQTDKNTLVENFYENNGFELIKKDDLKHYKFLQSVDINKGIEVKYDN
jgi:FkbH-like protein